LDSSLEIPPRKKKQNSDDDGEPMDWDEVVGKLLIRSKTREQIGDMTLRNVYQAVYAISDDRLWDARVAGCEVDDDAVEVDGDNIGWLEGAMNAAIRQGG
jgi:hypothetical protein